MPKKDGTPDHVSRLLQTMYLDDEARMDRLIDFHTHTQPSDEAAREFFGWIGIDPPNEGTVEDALRKMDAIGVERMLIVPWLPAQDLVAAGEKAGQPREAAVEAVVARWSALNGWAASVVRRYPNRFSCLVGVEPVLMSPDFIAVEIARRIEEGACGIKIAPMFLDVPPSDRRIRIVWELAIRHGVFVLSECGAHGTMGHEPWGHPRHFEGVLAEFPALTLMLAHLGMGAEQEVARLARKYPSVYADLSLRLTGVGTPGHWSHDEAVAVIRAIGAERVVYGTNYPIVDTAEFKRVFDDLPLNDSEREMIAYGNANHLLSLRRRA